MAVAEKNLPAATATPGATATNGATATTTDSKPKRTRNVVKLEVQAPVKNEATGKLDLRMATSEKVGMSLNLPVPLDTAIKEDATARKLNPNAVVRDLLAEHYGLYIIDNHSTRLSSYSGMTAEQAKAAKAADKAKKSKNVNAVLSAIAAGKMTPEIAAQLGIEL